MMTFDEAFNNIKRGKMIPFKKESLSKIQEAVELAELYFDTVEWVPIDIRHPKQNMLVYLTVLTLHNNIITREIIEGCYNSIDDTWHLNDDNYTNISITNIIAWMPKIYPLYVYDKPYLNIKEENENG